MKRCRFLRCRDENHCARSLYDAANDMFVSTDLANLGLISFSLCKMLPFARKSWGVFLAKSLGSVGLFKAARRAHVLSLHIRPSDSLLLESFVAFFDTVPDEFFDIWAQDMHYIRTWYQFAIRKRTSLHRDPRGQLRDSQLSSLDVAHLERLVVENLRISNWMGGFKASLLIIKLTGPSSEYWAFVVDCLWKMDQIEWAFYAERQLFAVFDIGASPAVCRHLVSKYGQILQIAGFSQADQLPALEFVQENRELLSQDLGEFAISEP